MYWGPPTWIFLHTLAAKIKEDMFPTIGPQLIKIIMTICYHLPCPECTEHAKHFWTSVVKVDMIKTKKDLINILFSFHNMVNKRKKQKIYMIDNLDEYNTKNLVSTFNDFAKNYHTKGNMQLINESFHRTKALNNVRGWLIQNDKYFDK
jgi:hypothetical protein